MRPKKQGMLGIGKSTAGLVMAGLLLTGCATTTSPISSSYDAPSRLMRSWDEQEKKNGQAPYWAKALFGEALHEIVERDAQIDAK
ncbi:MAG: hypothetical protein EBU96_05125 [Actinobacteria bacterium]|nr:hypothetical protein [Actinomycetota bacterium]